MSVITLAKATYRHSFKKQSAIAIHCKALGNFFKFFTLKNSFRLLLIILVSLALIFYLFQVNNLSVQGFTITKLEGDLESLTEINKELKLRVAHLRSINSLRKTIGELKMVKIDKATYISATSSTVAAK